MSKLSALTVLSVVALSACASTYEAVPYDRTSGAVKSVAIMDDSVGDSISAAEIGNVSQTAGSAFGIIGAVAGAAIEGTAAARRSSLIKKAIASQDFDVEAAFEKALKSKLSAEGYSTSVSGEDREKRKFKVSYPESEADAIMDVVFFDIGYVSANVLSDWKPTATAEVKLISTSSDEVLMQNKIAYNPASAENGTIVLPPNEAYSLKTIGETKEEAEKTTAGLDDAVTEIAAAIAQLMR